MSTLLAVSRWATTPAAEAATLAAELGIAVYDLTLRLNGPLPVLVATNLEDSAARRLLGGLRARNNGAICLDQHTLLAVADLYVPRTFSGDATGLVLSEPGKPPVSVRFGEIAALLRAKGSVESSTHIKTEHRTFSAAKAVMTGGLLVSKTVRSELSQVVAEQEQVLYIVMAAPARALVLQESTLHYEGLGALLQKTTAENFRILRQVLRDHAPQALYDERLFVQRRKRELVSLAGTTTNSEAISSNSYTNLLAAQLIVAAHREGQL
ncbi:MAG: hypothetical protein ABIJ09_25305 [Pseudomonadota bacterium]